MSKKFDRYLNNLTSSFLVEVGECDVSTKPIFSYGFSYCQGIALLGEGEGGLAHILPKDSAKESLEKMIESFKGVILGAVFLKSAASFYHGHNFEKECRDFQIPLLKTFLRGEEDGIVYKRELIVLPHKKQVRVYSEDGKIDVYRYLYDKS